MIFEWPIMLWSLLAVPILIGTFVQIRRRRRAAAMAYTQWASPASTPTVPRWRALTPPILFAISLITLFVALARPIAVIPIASFRDRVILAIDVSNSMQATDMQPSRLDAAKTAAKDFIDRQPSTTQIGIVAFAGTALPIQRPTYDREQLLKAVDKLEPQEGTAVGGAIQVALQTLFPKETFELERKDEKPEGLSLDAAPSTKPPPKNDEPPRVKVAPGSEDSAAIILLTDGEATAGPDPIEIARLAADRGVRVFTVGVGTADGEVVKAGGISMRVKLDEESLKKIADITLSRYFLAGTETDLREIYKNLSARLTTETRELEITSFMVAFAAGLIAVGSMLSLAWFDRVL